MSGRALAVGAALACAGLPLTACTEVEPSAATGYEPSKLERVGSAQRVTFTQEGVQRSGVRTAAVRREGRRTVVPYAALLYDGKGAPIVYAAVGARSFVRANVDVARITGDEVLLRDGPRAGTQVVTVGAAEVLGAELEIEGGH